jgi:hypothetical protein
VPDQSAPEKPAITLPRRSRYAMWLAMAAVVICVALAYVIDVRAAAGFLALALAGLAVLRMVSPAPGPYGISTRSRAFDVTALLIGAASVGFLGVFSPNL